MIKAIGVMGCGLMFAGCASGTDISAERDAQVEFLKEYRPCPDSQEQGDVLVIGDSISMMYTPQIAKRFPQMKVVHNPCNGMSSSHTAANAATWLAAQPRWKAITFNNGLWDINRGLFPNPNPHLYRANLEMIAELVKSKTDMPLFVLTTKVPEGEGGRRDRDVQLFNWIATDVMRSRGIPIVDLYTISDTIPQYRTAPNNVHFRPEGSAVLGDAVSDALNALGLWGPDGRH